MSNIVQVRIEARVPWTWAGDMPATEAACFAATFFNNVIGVQLEQRDAGYVDNHHGGRTHMVDVQISGMEALSWKYMARLARALADQGELLVAEAKDVQWEGEDNAWEAINWEHYQPPGAALVIEPAGVYSDGTCSYEVQVTGSDTIHCRDLETALLEGVQHLTDAADIDAGVWVSENATRGGE